MNLYTFRTEFKSINQIVNQSADKTTVGEETETDNGEMEEDLIDYNEVDDIVNHSRETKRKILRDALAENGFAVRNVLLSEPINHYASPFSIWAPSKTEFSCRRALLISTYFPLSKCKKHLMQNGNVIRQLWPIGWPQQASQWKSRWKRSTRCYTSTERGKSRPN